MTCEPCRGNGAGPPDPPSAGRTRGEGRGLVSTRPPMSLLGWAAGDQGGGQPPVVFAC
jgi:hypothetical protein